jgi:excisionase family DNA binding protein
MTAEVDDYGRGDTAREAVEDTAIASHSPRAFPISEFCRRYGIGRTTAYAEIAAGRLCAVKVGKRTLITADAAEAWLASLPKFERPPAEPRKRLAPG